MKVKGKGLIFKVVTILTAVLAFLGLAFKFAASSTVIVKGADAVKDSSTLKQWFDSIEGAKTLTKTGANFWQVSKVFLIISLVVIALIAVVALLQLFIENKYLSLAKLILSIVGIACVLIFFVTLVVGGVKVANAMAEPFKALGGSVSLMPHVGAYFITIFGLGSSVVALLDRKN